MMPPSRCVWDVTRKTGHRPAGRCLARPPSASSAAFHPQDPVLRDGTCAAVFELILGSPGLHIFVLELDGALVATTYLNVIPNLTRSASPYAVIENVVVEESLRGTGLGKQIMAATHAFYRACGFSAEAKTGYVARPS
jgi:GNAT superfamily N-acetyltransferase